jgi:predicted nucleotidyltransferase
MPVDPSELAHELVRRRKAELDENTRRADEVRVIVRAEVAALIREGLARRAWLIGSLAWGRFGVRSDVDVVLEGLAVARIGAVAERLAGHVHADVDILRIEEIPATFRQRVLAEGIELVA